MNSFASTRPLNSGEIAIFRELLTVFGDAFEEHETYSAKQPDDRYIEQLLSGEHFVALDSTHPCLGRQAKGNLMVSVSVSVDVPSLEEGVRFYADAFGFSKVSAPVPGVVVLRVGASEICLLEKEAGSAPAPGIQESRHYGRHWTPVHMDFHVDDLRTTLAKAVEAGARQEQLFAGPGHPAVAFCSDPFGHGFCLIERKNTRTRGDGDA